MLQAREHVKKEGNTSTASRVQCKLYLLGQKLLGKKAGPSPWAEKKDTSSDKLRERYLIQIQAWWRGQGYRRRTFREKRDRRVVNALATLVAELGGDASGVAAAASGLSDVFSQRKKAAPPQRVPPSAARVSRATSAVRFSSDEAPPLSRPPSWLRRGGHLLESRCPRPRRRRRRRGRPSTRSPTGRPASAGSRAAAGAAAAALRRGAGRCRPGAVCEDPRGRASAQASRAAAERDGGGGGRAAADFHPRRGRPRLLVLVGRKSRCARAGDWRRARAASFVTAYSLSDGASRRPSSRRGARRRRRGRRDGRAGSGPRRVAPPGPGPTSPVMTSRRGPPVEGAEGKRWQPSTARMRAHSRSPAGIVLPGPSRQPGTVGSLLMYMGNWSLSSSSDLFRGSSWTVKGVAVSGSPSTGPTPRLLELFHELR